jgi:4'-phosphopantetheinyl transferase EntD
VVGSIAHVTDHVSGAFFAAAAGRADTISALGIDFEREGSVHPRTWRLFLGERELWKLLSLPVDLRRAEAHFLWCAKEATIKAIGQSVDPRSIHIQHDRAAGEYIASIAHATACSPTHLIGRTGFCEGFFVATVMLPMS